MENAMETKKAHLAKDDRESMGGLVVDGLVYFHCSTSTTLSAHEDPAFLGHIRPLNSDNRYDLSNKVNDRPQH